MNLTVGIFKTGNNIKPEVQVFDTDKRPNRKELYDLQEQTKRTMLVSHCKKLMKTFSTKGAKQRLLVEILSLIIENTIPYEAGIANFALTLINSADLKDFILKRNTIAQNT